MGGFNTQMVGVVQMAPQLLRVFAPKEAGAGAGIEAPQNLLDKFGPAEFRVGPCFASSDSEGRVKQQHALVRPWAQVAIGGVKVQVLGQFLEDVVQRPGQGAHFGFYREGQTMRMAGCRIGVLS